MRPFHLLRRRGPLAPGLLTAMLCACAPHGASVTDRAAAAPLHPSSAPTIALTFDDGPNLMATPLLSAAQRNQALLDALAQHGVQATLFVTVDRGADRPEGLALARAWGAAGHTVGNHTVTHPDLNASTVTLAGYQREVLDCDLVIATLPGYRRWFRYTYLREGNTPEKRDGMRRFLAEWHYRNAHVTLDTSDWRLNGALMEVLRRDPGADLSPLRQAYLEHLWQRATAYRRLSNELLGRNIAQVMLLHHNLINALWLGDAIAMFQERGWHFVAPERAYADPAYASPPERQVPGQSLLLSLARAQGRDRFDGWERLVDDGDAEIDSLRQQGVLH